MPIDETWAREHCGTVDLMAEAVRLEREYIESLEGLYDAVRCGGDWSAVARAADAVSAARIAKARAGA